MSSTHAVTAEELLRMGEGKRELILGEVVELTPPAMRHGLIQARVAYLLMRFLEDADVHDFVTTESGYQLTFGPDTVRAPDVALVSAARVEGGDDEKGYLPIAPDLAVEVISPSDSFTDVETKAQMWLDHGTRLVWVVEPDSRRVFIYEAARDRRDVGEGEVLSGEEVVPGFKVPVDRLFTN